MSELVFYDSSQNVANDRLKQTIKMSGSLSWKIPSNKSAKCTIKFSQPFPAKPTLLHSLSIDDGNVLDVKNGIGSLTKEGFDLHISNLDLANETSGVFIWQASFN